MAALPPTSSLEDLPEDIQRLILRRIPCAADRSAMARASPEWRDVVRHLQDQEHPPPLPWLLLPTALNPEDDAAHTHRVACVLSGCGVHRCLTVDPPGARCFGSHDGAWLLLDHRGGNHARNVRTVLVERLPADLLTQGGVPLDDMVVLAAALSSSPDDAACVAAAIVTCVDNTGWPPQQHRCLAMWRKGWGLAREHVPPSAYDVISRPSWIGDIVYRDGAFQMLTQGFHIRVCTPAIKQPYDDDLFVDWETRRFQPGGLRYDRNLFVRDRYLVVSRGELLLVLRFAPGPNQPTSNFKVYQATDADATNTYYPAAQYPWAWSELDTLDGRMLFVGHCCSRSYEVDQYPSFEAAIYFWDDGMFYNDAVIFSNGDATCYPCSDNGKWTEDGHVQRCFPRSDPSGHSAPIWLLP